MDITKEEQLLEKELGNPEVPNLPIYNEYSDPDSWVAMEKLFGLDTEADIDY